VLRFKWEYHRLELKTQDGRDYIWDEVAQMGEDGWEVVAFVPLPKPDPEGVVDTTIGYLLFKRPEAA
jgi:hypothetical protein